MSSGQQYELLDWLAKVTFPMEAKFADPQLAERAYRSIVRRVIDSGVSISRDHGLVEWHLKETVDNHFVLLRFLSR